MMSKVFGLLEAKRADEFAKTEDHRRVVLAVARMFGIPIVIDAQTTTKVARAEVSIGKGLLKIDKLNGKIEKLRTAKDVNMSSKLDALAVSKQWYIE